MAKSRLQEISRTRYQNLPKLLTSEEIDYLYAVRAASRNLLYVALQTSNIVYPKYWTRHIGWHSETAIQEHQAETDPVWNAYFDYNKTHSLELELCSFLNAAKIWQEIQKAGMFDLKEFKL